MAASSTWCSLRPARSERGSQGDSVRSLGPFAGRRTGGRNELRAPRSGHAPVPLLWWTVQLRCPNLPSLPRRARVGSLLAMLLSSLHRVAFLRPVRWGARARATPRPDRRAVSALLEASVIHAWRRPSRRLTRRLSAPRVPLVRRALSEPRHSRRHRA